MFQITCIYAGPADGLHSIMTALAQAQAIDVKVFPINVPNGAAPNGHAEQPKRARRKADDIVEFDIAPRPAPPRYGGPVSREVAMRMLKRGPLSARALGTKFAKMGRSSKSAHPLLYQMEKNGEIIRTGSAGDPTYELPPHKPKPKKQNAAAAKRAARNARDRSRRAQKKVAALEARSVVTE